MKKIIASTGLAALGAASLQAAYAPGLTAVQTSKPWSVSAVVRGFYDDNYNTRPSHPSDGFGPKRSSWGTDISPSASINFPLEQTYIGLSYTYDMRYYADRHGNSADHSHQADVKLSHQFSPHYKVDASDSFVVAQEPQLLADSSGLTSAFLRANGNNIRNSGTATFSADLTDRLSTQVGYSNSLWDYEQKGDGSYAAVLNRMDHLGTVNLRWQMLPSTVGILGYQYEQVDHTDKTDHLDPNTGGIGLGPLEAVNQTTVRDTRSHYVFVGADQNFTTQLNASARVGVQYEEYPNVTSGTGLTKNTVSPYADANFTYTYNPGSYIQLGVKHQRYATDVALQSDPHHPILDSDSTTVYASLNHKITAKLNGNVLAQFQNSQYHQSGAGADKEDDYFTVGVNLAYQINQYLTAETGYNFDRLDSDYGNRSFTRNRLYLGVRAAY